MSLPIPTDPKFVLPKPSDAEFFDTSAPEDEDLLATGAWNDEPDDDDAEAEDVEPAKP